MQLAILSGKGGAGKTLLAVNLTNLIDHATLLDCDVEEPNGVFYFSDTFHKQEIFNKIPVIDHDKCIHCHACIDFCRFNALIDFLGKTVVLPSLCHSCGGCQLVCQQDAITEKDELIGWINSAKVNGKNIYGGELKIGKETGVLLIEKLREKASLAFDTVIDCPPGNGCSVMESISEADYCVLLSEPTIFGLENLKMVYELTQVYHKKSGIVINKTQGDSGMIESFAKENNIPLLGRIPFDRELALLDSNHEIVSNYQYRYYFESILERIKEEVSK